MQAPTLSLLFAAALLASLLTKFWLATRQMRHVAAHRGAVPAPFASTITLAAHQRAADYTLAKGDRKSTRLNSSHVQPSRMPSSA